MQISRGVMPPVRGMSPPVRAVMPPAGGMSPLAGGAMQTAGGVMAFVMETAPVGSGMSHRAARKTQIPAGMCAASSDALRRESAAGGGPAIARRVSYVVGDGAGMETGKRISLPHRDGAEMDLQSCLCCLVGLCVMACTKPFNPYPLHTSLVGGPGEAPLVGAGA